jgi:NosR/NirI family transcriptional regulator, nitrous oxide reductase regulator
MVSTPLARPTGTTIQFGVPELALLLLFAAAYAGHRVRNGAWKRRVRWGTLLAGMVVLGFIYTAPLTITMIISLLSGYWPDWHNNLYWYLLLGGILFVTTVDAKNPYCYWFCPFGAVAGMSGQAVSGARPTGHSTLARGLQWVQRGLAVIAIGLGLALRRPGSPALSRSPRSLTCAATPWSGSSWPSSSSPAWPCLPPVL